MAKAGNPRVTSSEAELFPTCEIVRSSQRSVRFFSILRYSSRGDRPSPAGKLIESAVHEFVEVFNTATALRRYNRYAFKYAQVRNLPMVAASDAHHAAAVDTAYTILNTDDFSVKGILAQIVKSNELNQRYLTPRDSLRKTWNNWLRLRRRKKIPELAAKDARHNGR
jgi:PHP-associated